MKEITNLLYKGNLSARERFILLAQNDINKAKTGEDILTEADKDALENQRAKDNDEAREWNRFNEGWKASGRMDLEVEFIYKDAQVSYFANLVFDLALSTYGADQRMRGAIKALKKIKKVTAPEAIEIIGKQRKVKLKEGLDFDYVVYQLAFELLSSKDKKEMKDLYGEVEYDSQYLDQEEVIANLFNKKEELTTEAKKKLADMIAERSYNEFAKEYQLFHYFACIPILEIAKYALKSKGVEVKDKEDDDDYESERVKKAMEQYAVEHGTTVTEMIRKACLAALDSGLLDDHTPLVVSNSADLFNRWLEKKKEARKILKEHINAGELGIRRREDNESRWTKLHSKKLYDGELKLTRKILEDVDMPIEYKGEDEERVAFETFDDLVLTGESLYEFKKDYEFVKDFKRRVDKYDPNLGIVYADNDPNHKGPHLDQELLICGYNKKNGETNFFSRYGMSVTILSNFFESLAFLKKTEENGKSYLEFKNPLYEETYKDRRKTLADAYRQLLAYEEISKKLDKIYETEMSWHVSTRLKEIREFVEKSNEAVRIATNTQKDDLEKTKKLLRRKDKLYLKENWIIDLDYIEPDRSVAEKHIEKLKSIFRYGELNLDG